jgi:hypothetical protein
MGELPQKFLATMKLYTHAAALTAASTKTMWT